MFGLKLFTDAKNKKYANKKNRKQYYAIRDYYRKKSQTEKTTLYKGNKKK